MLTWVGEVKSSQVMVDSSSRHIIFAAVLTCAPPEQLTSNVSPAGGASLQLLPHTVLHSAWDDPPRKSAPRMSAGVHAYSFAQYADAQSRQNCAPALDPPPPQPAANMTDASANPGPRTTRIR